MKVCPLKRINEKCMNLLFLAGDTLNITYSDQKLSQSEETITKYQNYFLQIVCYRPGFSP